MQITPPQLLNKSKRQSNIELFRIVAMFLVLVVHADFFSLQAPTPNEFHASRLPTIGRLFFESLSIGCVNMFVLISGWFGIRPKVRSFSNFLFQCLFFLIGIYAVCLAFGLADFSLRGVAGCFALLRQNYWFIKAYVGLYIMAPVLNAYVEHATKLQLGRTLVFFYLFQTVYSWVSGAAVFFESGYSTMSFAGLYMLARYAHLYPHRLTAFPARYDFLIFIGVVLFHTLLGAASLGVGVSFLIGKINSYVNPLVIISSLYLLLGFTKLRFSYRLVNAVAASSFAVYLLHANPNLCKPYFCRAVQFIYHETSGMLCVSYIFIFLVLVFVVAIIADRLRIRCWNILWRMYERRQA